MMKKAVLLLFVFLLVLPVVFADMGPHLYFKNNLIEYSFWFLLALVITLTMETFVTFECINKWKGKYLEKKDRILYTVLLANLISLPIFWFAFPINTPNGFTQMAISEIAIIFFEAIFIYYLNRQTFKLSNAFLLSVLNNVASFGAGLITLFLFFTLLFAVIPIVAFAYFFYKMRKEKAVRVIFLVTIAAIIVMALVDITYTRPYIGYSPYSDCKMEASTCRMKMTTGITGAVCLEDCITACQDHWGEDVVVIGVIVDENTCNWQGPLGAATACSYCARGTTSGW